MKIKGNTKLPTDQDIVRRLKKGITPNEIVKNLQEDFLANGLEAYENFKRLGIGVEHDENGRPIQREVKRGEVVITDLEDIDAFKYQPPPWMGDGDRRGTIIDTNEA